MASKRLGAAAFAVAALLATTSACSSDDGGSGAADGKINLAVFASVNGAPAFAGDDEGVFEDNDLDVALTTAKTSSEMIPQLIGGKVDIALLDVATSLVAIGQGMDLVYIAGGTDGGIPEGQEDFSFANVWVAKNSGIDSMADLEGKKVGIPQIKSQPWLDLRASVDEAGGDSSRVKFVESPDPLTALKSGQVDATTTPEPVGTIERAKGELKLLGPTNSGGGGHAYVYVTTAAFAKKNPDVVESFAEAVRAANAKVNADKDLLVSTIAEVIKAPSDVLAKSALPVYTEAALTEDDVQFSIDYLEKYDMFEQGAPAAADVLFTR
ncbi:ABC transporter substrate-binding protein [Nocardioides sp. zg-ZUI104]|uniref:ABC transporter substrate-binding protein n=1 Tax=Nocardioides faecalis TaxID=2803858 RepID=UPI001BD0B366|nr:ABC transporter substrate-binding protein [Nocardioides faecalis]MBS4752139.1 ABC transporter substrate-binding protein [Nocardioides faecalis]